MDPKTKEKAAAVLVRCRGYSRNMAANCLETLTDEEITALARVAVPVTIEGRPANDYLVIDGCGEYVALVLDEIADRKAWEEAEKKRLAKPLNQGEARDETHARDRYDEARQRRQACGEKLQESPEAVAVPAGPVAEDDEDDVEPDDPTDVIDG